MAYTLPKFYCCKPFYHSYPSLSLPSPRTHTYTHFFRAFCSFRFHWANTNLTSPQIPGWVPLIVLNQLSMDFTTTDPWAPEASSSSVIASTLSIPGISLPIVSIRNHIIVVVSNKLLKKKRKTRVCIFALPNSCLPPRKLLGPWHRTRTHRNTLERRPCTFKRHH